MKLSTAKCTTMFAKRYSAYMRCTLADLRVTCIRKLMVSTKVATQDATPARRELSGKNPANKQYTNCTTAVAAMHTRNASICAHSSAISC